MNYKILLLASKLISRGFSISFCQHVLMRMKEAVKEAVKQVLSKSQKLNGIMKANVNSLQALANILILTTEKTNKK